MTNQLKIIYAKIPQRF